MGRYSSLTPHTSTLYCPLTMTDNKIWHILLKYLWFSLERLIYSPGSPWLIGKLNVIEVNYWEVCMTESTLLNVFVFSCSGLNVSTDWWWPKHIILQTNSTWKNNKHPAVSNFSNDIMEITWLAPPGFPAHHWGLWRVKCLLCPPHWTQLLQMFWSRSTLHSISHSFSLYTNTRPQNAGRRHSLSVPLFIGIIIL